MKCSRKKVSLEYEVTRIYQRKFLSAIPISAEIEGRCRPHKFKPSQNIFSLIAGRYKSRNQIEKPLHPRVKQ